MSFYAYKNSQLTMAPGPLGPDGTRDLNEKVCIQVKKVYDSCMQQEQLDVRGVQFNDIHPIPSMNCPMPPITQPLTLCSCRSTDSKGELLGLVVEPLPDRCNFCRVRCTVAIPVEALFEDAEGVRCVGTGCIYVPKDVVLYVPDDSIIPYSVDSLCSCISVTGCQVNENTFNMTLCVTIILKIIADVELLVPAYGFCQIPPCEDFAENVCDDFFSLPLFPPQPGQCKNTMGINNYVQSRCK